MHTYMIISYFIIYIVIHIVYTYMRMMCGRRDGNFKLCLVISLEFWGSPTAAAVIILYNTYFVLFTSGST